MQNQLKDAKEIEKTLRWKAKEIDNEDEGKGSGIIISTAEKKFNHAVRDLNNETPDETLKYWDKQLTIHRNEFVRIINIWNEKNTMILSMHNYLQKLIDLKTTLYRMIQWYDRWKETGIELIAENGGIRDKEKNIVKERDRLNGLFGLHQIDIIDGNMVPYFNKKTGDNSKDRYVEHQQLQAPKNFTLPPWRAVGLYFGSSSPRASGTAAGLMGAAPGTAAAASAAASGAAPGRAAPRATGRGTGRGRPDYPAARAPGTAAPRRRGGHSGGYKKSKNKKKPKGYKRTHKNKRSCDITLPEKEKPKVYLKTRVKRKKRRNKHKLSVKIKN